MKYSVVEIIDFLKNLAGTDNINPDSDIFDDVGMMGDDFHEMIENFADKFSVDMANYLWYFHTDEEGGPGFGGIFFKPPYVRVQRIPVTPLMLTDFANKGKWALDYPENELPKRRYDLIVNAVIFGIVLLLLIIWVILKISN